jgi:hypothetical protein
MVAQMKGPGVAPAVTGGLEDLGHPTSGTKVTGDLQASSATFPVDGRRWTIARGIGGEGPGPDQPAHPRIQNAGHVSIGGSKPEAVPSLQSGNTRSVLSLSKSGPARLTLN